MRKSIFIVGLIAIAVSGCAKRASSVVPVDIPMAAFDNLSCEELARELINERTKMSALTKRQNDAAVGDAVGVFLIGVPTASLTGFDQEGELAVSKGKVLSIENTVQAKGCNSISAVTPPPVDPAAVSAAEPVVVSAPVE